MEKETNKFHALQLFTDTFSAETVHLTNDAVGIYIRLLSFAWTKNAKPFKTESAYRICQCRDDNCCINVYEVLEEFFILQSENKENRNKNTWVHKRLIKEHEYLTAKYKARSEAGRKGGLAKSNNASSKMIAPIPIPSPIPKSNIQPMFDKFWSLLTYKKGSKYLANKKYELYCSKSNPKDISDRFNRYASTVKDKEFLAHVSTWLNQKRFEDEETNKPKKIIDPIYEYNGIKLQKKGIFGEFIELIDNQGNKYQKHKFNQTPIEKIS